MERLAVADPTREEVERVVAGLTDAQRRALLHREATNWPNRNKLIEMGLAKPGAARGMRDIVLTDLGRAVAAKLRGEGERHDDPATEALAEVWATMDGKREEFAYGKTDRKTDEWHGGYYAGYMADAEGMIEGLREKGFVLVRAEDRPNA